MKPIFLSSPSSHRDILNYGEELFNRLVSEYDAAVYQSFKPDFSDVPELYTDEEKILLFNHFALPDGFVSLSEHLPKFKNVKYILSPYSSYAGLDLEKVKSLGIKYRNNGGANAKSVSQYAIACMFSLLSRIPELSAQSTSPDGTILGQEYHQRTAGIIGMGNVGKELLNTLNRLGIKTVYYNRTPQKVDAQLVALEEVFQQDIVFITIATNPDTKKMLANIGDLIQEKNYLIDVTGYDDQYDKQRIIDLLNAGQMQGYALETESHFTSDKNFLATPHIAWCTVDAEKRTVELFLQRALTILEGKQNEVDFIV